jgi:hypothetical protein
MTKADQSNKKSGDDDGPPHVNIQIDREHFRVEATTLTGAQIRALPATPIAAGRDLFQVVPGGTDLKIADTDVVTLKSGIRFFTAPSQINPGAVFGC